jgi:hypothetical protein
MMAAFLPLLWGASAQAQQVTETVRLCVEIDIDLYDAQHGDWWTTGQDR